MLSLTQGAVGLASGSLVGFSLGLVGGGGSILAVPCNPPCFSRETAWRRLEAALIARSTMAGPSALSAAAGRS
jgi:uncharacterized membrane protein YfcA